MAGTIQDFASAVEHVISVCRDAEQGYRGAADAVRDPSLKQTFTELSAKRGRYAAELQEAVRAMGFDATNPLGFGGTLHGAWMSLKGAITGHEPHAILEETEPGEDISMKAYRDALAVNMPTGLRTIVEQQFQQVQKDHAEIRAMRDRTATRPAPAPPPEPR